MENDQLQNGEARKEAGGVPDPALSEKIKGVRAKVHESFGQVALAMTATPRYRHLSVADLQHLFLEPLIRDRAEPEIGDGGAREFQTGGEGGQVAKEGELRVHPLVARLIDAELLKQMARRPTAAQRPEAVN